MNGLRIWVPGLLLVPVALAQTCTIGDIRGTYLIQSTGQQSTASSAVAPARALGLVRFDGSGQATGRMTITMGGAIDGVTSTYDFADFTITLNPDCTGQGQYQLKGDGDGVLGPDRVEILVLEEGARVWAQVVQSSGRTVQMTSEFQRIGLGSRACAQTMVRGSYLFRGDGVIDQRAMNPRAAAAFVPAYGSGVLAVDPETGAVTGSGSSRWAGASLHTVPKDGAFRVNADCTGTYEYQMQVVETNGTIGGSAPLIITGNGERLFLLMPSLPAIYIYERVSIP